MSFLCTDAPNQALRRATPRMQISETKPVVEEELKKNSCRPAKKQGREHGPTVRTVLRHWSRQGLHGQRSDLIKGGVLMREATQPFLVHAACVTKTIRSTEQRPASVTRKQRMAKTLTFNGKRRETTSAFTITCADTFTNARQGYDRWRLLRRRNAAVETKADKGCKKSTAATKQRYVTQRMSLHSLSMHLLLCIARYFLFAFAAS